MAFYYGIHNVAQYLMSAFGAKADMPIALHMSAFDPKRTSVDRRLKAYQPSFSVLV